MFIIGKHKDFYDAVCHRYGGVDKSVVFDRRAAAVIELGWIPKWLVDEKGRGPLKATKKVIKLERDEHFLLEAGFKQYLIKATKIVARREETVLHSLDFNYSCDFEIVQVFDEGLHLFGPVVSLHRGLRRNTPTGAPRSWWYDKDYYAGIKTVKEFDFSRERERERLDLPILAESGLTKVLDAEDVWKAILNYLTAAKKDKDVDIGTTDVEKAVNHGFDKKSSFRNPTKPADIRLGGK